MLVAVTTAIFMRVVMTVASAVSLVVSVAAAPLFGMSVTMTVASAAACRSRFHVVGQFPGEQKRDRFIGRAAVAGIQLDAGFFECADGAAAETAADDAVNGVFHQKIDHGTVTVAAGFQQFATDNGVVFKLIDLESRCHAEVLKNIVVFKGNCDLHVKDSLNTLRYGLQAGSFSATPRAGAAVRFLTNSVIAAVDDERSAVDDCVGDLESSLLVDFRYRGSGNIHLTGALIVRPFFQIDESNGFVFLNKQHDGSTVRRDFRQEASDVGFTANASTATRSWHDSKWQTSNPTNVGNKYSAWLQDLSVYFSPKPLLRRNSCMKGRRSRLSTPEMPCAQESLRGLRLRDSKYRSVSAS